MKKTIANLTSTNQVAIGNLQSPVFNLPSSISNLGILVLFTLVFSLSTFNLTAQNVGINSTGVAPDNSALLDIDASPGNNKGLLIPRLTTIQRNAIVSPANSLLIYNTTTQCYEGYNAGTSTWVAFGCIGCTVPSAVTATAAPIPICVGSTLTLTGGGTNVTGWSWTGPNGFTSALQSPTVANITTAGAGIYTLAASNNCGSVSANTVAVTVTAAPTVAVAGAAQTLACGLTSTTLAGNTPTTGTGLWSVISGTATITTPSSPTSGITGLAAAGAVTLRWTISNAPCTPSTNDVIITTSSCAPSSITAGSTVAGSPCPGPVTTIPITKPAGVVSGNILIVGITTNGCVTMTPPTGWVLIGSNCTSPGANSYIYYKVAGASEPASYSFTTNFGTYPSWVITNFTGTFRSPPLNVNSYANTSSYTASSVTTSVNNEMLVVIYSSGNGANTWSTPGGMTAGYAGGQNCTSTGIFYEIQALAGSSGTKTGNPSILDTGQAYLIALF